MEDSRRNNYAGYCRVATAEQLEPNRGRKRDLGSTLRDVTVIPASIHPLTRLSPRAVTKRRVAAYARVSTDSEEQLTSYAAQIDYYTNYIQQRSDWELVQVYTDEGISATSTRHRDGFNDMISYALAGGIDLIVTKSVSRFARNTVDSLVTIRKLKEVGCECYFEKENIYTFEGKGELLLTIMSSLAQEESRSISENVTWGQRKRFADGKVSLPYKHFLGYTKGPDGIPVIVPEEAAIVQRIYQLFMSGKTPNIIAKTLTEEGIPTPAGKQRWCTSTIYSILTNEKYKGSARLQKKFTVDFLNKKMKINEGEVPQYYVEHSHEGIIDPEEWEAVQNEITRRKSMKGQYSGKSVIASRIVCGDCGAFYGSKVWHSNSKYRKTIWQCNQKFNGEDTCHTPALNEEEIKKRFLAVFSSLLESKDSILDDCRTAQTFLCDCTHFDRQIEELYQEIEVVTELTKRHVSLNSQHVQDQDDYLERYNGLVDRYEELKARIAELQQQRNDRHRKADTIGGFMFVLSELDGYLSEFDDHLWLAAIEIVTAHADGRLTFRFQNGMEVDG